MKILGINSGNRGSSWNIACNILLNAEKQGHDVIICTQNKPEVLPPIRFRTFGSKCLSKINSLLTKIEGKDGFRNNSETKKLIKIIEEENPDLLHIHTIHGHSLNIEKLLNYTSKKKIPIIVTMHDCWWFTGRCSHFLYKNCDLWKFGCHNCKHLDIYPKSILFDGSAICTKKKIQLFEKNKICFVGVSEWLKDCALESFILKNQKVITIHNGLNMNNEISTVDIKEDGRKIILAVAVPWSIEKGQDFIEYLDKKLDYAKYRLVVVGMKDGVLSNQAENITTYLTRSQLNFLYKKAAVFINPSKQESLSTVNIEAQINGTQTVAFDVSSMRETVFNKKNLIEPYDFDCFYKRILTVCEESKENISANFLDGFSMNTFLDKYLKLYEEWSKK